MPHAFISYVREDTELVNHVSAILRANGVEVWLDRANIQPGVRWRDAIRTAIRDGHFFVPFFSSSWAARARTYANEELNLAIEELRLRPRQTAWFLPLRTDRTQIPDYPLGGGETLADIQAIDFTELGWEESLLRLLQALGVVEPVLFAGEPLAPGLPAAVSLVDGELIYEHTEPLLPGLQGAVYHVSGGWCERPNGAEILAYIETRAPNAVLQQINEQANLDSFFARCLDAAISTDPLHPSRFHFRREFEFPQGFDALNPLTSERVSMPVAMAVITEFIAWGAAQGDRLAGTFNAIMDYSLPAGGDRAFRFDLRGTFNIRFVPRYDPPRSS